MIMDIGSVEALDALFDWKAEKSWLSAWLALLLELLLLELLLVELASVEELLAPELLSLAEEA